MSLTPRQIAKSLLQGEAPPRPLLLPIAFALGAKVENVPPRSFVTNPTKIVNAARQMRNHLQADGAACYCDRYLEVEALGAVLHRYGDDQPLEVEWTGAARLGELPEGLCSPEEAAKNGRIPLVTEVLRRMNAVPNRDFLLMASVSGPLTLAAMLTQAGREDSSGHSQFSAEVLEFASSVTTRFATAYLEAGADTIFIHEEIQDNLSDRQCQEWSNLLSPIINVTRFYEALPVLQLADTASLHDSWDAIQRQTWECVTCALASVVSLRPAGGTGGAPSNLRGIALPSVVFAPSANRDAMFANCRGAVAQTQPAIITTEGDVPLTTDIKQLKNALDEIRRRS